MNDDNDHPKLISVIIPPDRPSARIIPMRPRASAKALADMVPEMMLCRLSRHMSLGLDCNVPLTAYREAVEELFSELRKCGWRINPPDGERA